MYRDRFQFAADAEYYDQVVYASDAADTYLWQLERPILTSVVKELRASHERVKYLDFACGSGRVISFVAPLVDQSCGVDISEAMLQRARRAVPTATFHRADIANTPTLSTAPFHLITCYRFLLNLEPELRVSYLKALRMNLAPHGRLLLNIQGNTHSLRHFARWSRATDIREFNEMSLKEVRTVVDAASLRTRRWWGFGLLPRRCMRPAVAPLVAGVERLAFSLRVPQRFSHTLLVECTSE